MTLHAGQQEIVWASKKFCYHFWVLNWTFSVGISGAAVWRPETHPLVQPTVSKCRNSAAAAEGWVSVCGPNTACKDNVHTCICMFIKHQTGIDGITSKEFQADGAETGGGKLGKVAMWSGQKIRVRRT